MVKDIKKEDISKLSKENLVNLVGDNLSKFTKKELNMVNKITQRNISRIEKLEKLFYERPIVKVPLFLVLIFTMMFAFDVFLPKDNDIIVFISSFMGIAVSAYLFFFIFYIMKTSLKSLFQAKHLAGIFISYLLFITCLMIIFSNTYAKVEDLDRGYLTYGICSDDFDKSMIQQDNKLSQDYFYYSAVTFFTVGYGDICPMGWNKYVSLLNAFIGNFITVVVMVLVISSYMKRSDNNF